MNPAAMEARRKYKREWQRAHKDRQREYQERYWTKKAQAAALAGTKEPNAVKEGAAEANDI